MSLQLCFLFESPALFVWPLCQRVSKSDPPSVAFGPAKDRWLSPVMELNVSQLMQPPIESRLLRQPDPTFISKPQR